ncbi:hypothetical protein MCEKH45_01430 [Methylophilaceae bacterium]
MNEITLFDVALVTTAFFCLIAGLSIKWHKNLALFVFSCYYVLSDVINPVLFMFNEDMYAYDGWSAVKHFNFSITSLVKSYSGSYFVYSVIALMSILLSFSGLLKKTSPVMKVGGFLENKTTNKVLYVFCFSLIFIYYFLYKYRIGITGVGGELPYHLSGVVHYLRIYVISIILAFLVNRSRIDWRVISIVFLYAFITGVAAASRLIVVVTIATLIFELAYRKRFFLVIGSILFVLVMWFVVSTSRELTFSGEQYDLFEVIYFSVTETSLENLIGILDQLTGRLSGAQQIVLAYQFRGFEGCGFILDFFMGQPVCKDTIGDVYGLDLSGTSYGLGLSVIPSILISGKELIDYFLPAIIIFFFISLTELLFRTAISTLKNSAISYFYFFLSITFLFSGPLIFFYYLQFTAILSFIALKGYRKFLLMLKSMLIVKSTRVKSVTMLDSSAVS